MSPLIGSLCTGYGGLDLAATAHFGADVPGLSWNEALAACGNGVVPQQALEALRRIDRMVVA